MPTVRRLPLLLAALVAIAPMAGAIAEEPAQAFARECGRCHAPAELRESIGGIRRLWWTDERLTTWLLRHHAHDEAQARLIIRFLREGS